MPVQMAKMYAHKKYSFDSAHHRTIKESQLSMVRHNFKPWVDSAVVVAINHWGIAAS